MIRDFGYSSQTNILPAIFAHPFPTINCVYACVRQRHQDALAPHKAMLPLSVSLLLANLFTEIHLVHDTAWNVIAK